VTVREFLDTRDSSPFEKWFVDLDPTAAAKVTTTLLRMELGNFSRAKGVGAGVFEYRIDFGPGYRVYFGKDGDTLVPRHLARWRDQEATKSRHRDRAGQVEGLQAAEVAGEMKNGSDARL